MTEIWPKIHRRTSNALGLIVNLYLVETVDGVVLVDGAISRRFAEQVRAEIAALGKPVLGALLTHGHPDHYIGMASILADWPQVPIYARAGARAQAEARARTEQPGMQTAFGDDFPDIVRLPDTVIEDGAAVTLGDLVFTMTDYGRAESDSDGTWTLSADANAHVFCGDLIYVHMHLFMMDGHATAWLAALDRLSAAHPFGTVFYPGHGEPSGHALVHWNRGYIGMYLEALGRLLGSAHTTDEGGLDAVGKAHLVANLRAYLPSDALLELARFNLDTTISNLRAQARQAVGG